MNYQKIIKYKNIKLNLISFIFKASIAHYVDNSKPFEYKENIISNIFIEKNISKIILENELLNKLFEK